jgi:hypothetical protein
MSLQRPGSVSSSSQAGVFADRLWAEFTSAAGNTDSRQVFLNGRVRLICLGLILLLGPVRQSETRSGAGLVWAAPPAPSAISDLSQPAIVPVAGRRETTSISALGSGTFDERQRVMWGLWRDRESSRDSVLLAMADLDPEISSRAAWIIERWRRGILAQTPAGLVGQLESTSVQDAFAKLLDLGMFEGARVAIEEAIDIADDAALTRATLELRRGFPFHVRSADEHGQLEDFAILVDRLARTPEMLVCRNQLWKHLGLQPEFQPGSISDAAALEEKQQRMALVALVAADRYDEAIELARQADQPEWLRVSLMLAARWSDLAVSEAALAAAAETAEERDRHWAYALVAAHRSGDQALRAQAVEMLAYRPGDEAGDPESDPQLRLRWQVLAMHGEIDAAVDILRHSKPLVAAEILGQAGRPADAFAMLEWRIDQTDSSLPGLLAEARAAIETWQPNPREVPPQLERLLTVSRLLYQTGRRDAAWELFSGVIRWKPATAKPDPEEMARAFVLQAMLRSTRADWLANLILRSDGLGLSATDIYFLARAFDVKVEVFDPLYSGLAELLPEAKPQSIRATIDFLEGRIPAGFDSENDYQRLYDWLIERGAAIAARRARQPQGPVIRLTPDFATLFEDHGQLELSRKFLIHLASAGYEEAIASEEALLCLAEAELKAGRAGSAKELFETSWERLDRLRRQPAESVPTDDLAALAMRALLGKAVAAKRLGDEADATRTWRLIDLMMCTPSAALRDAFGARLLDQGFDERADRIYQELLPWLAFNTDENVEFYNVSRNYHRAAVPRDPVRAAEALDLAIVGTIESAVFYPAVYVSLPALVHRHKILAAVPAKNIEAIRRDVDTLLRLHPVDIELGEEAIKEFRKAGLTELADETIERIFLSGDDYLRRCPLDIQTANNLAWVLALSDHRLDEAERLSWRAVYSAPESSVYRDTLAEILFRQGRTAEAIAIAEACLLDAPGEWHLREQLRRFRGEEAED